MSLALILASLQGRRAGFSWDSHGERHNPRAAMFVSSPPLLPGDRTQSLTFTVLLAISILKKTTKLIFFVYEGSFGGLESDFCVKNWNT